MLANGALLGGYVSVEDPRLYSGTADPPFVRIGAWPSCKAAPPSARPSTLHHARGDTDLWPQCYRTSPCRYTAELRHELSASTTSLPQPKHLSHALAEADGCKWSDAGMSLFSFIRDKQTRRLPGRPHRPGRQRSREIACHPSCAMARICLTAHPQQIHQLKMAITQLCSFKLFRNVSVQVSQVNAGVKIFAQRRFMDLTCPLLRIMLCLSCLSATRSVHASQRPAPNTSNRRRNTLIEGGIGRFSVIAKERRALRAMV